MARLFNCFPADTGAPMYEPANKLRSVALTLRGDDIEDLLGRYCQHVAMPDSLRFNCWSRYNRALRPDAGPVTTHLIRWCQLSRFNRRADSP